MKRKHRKEEQLFFPIEEYRKRVVATQTRAWEDINSLIAILLAHPQREDYNKVIENVKSVQRQYEMLVFGAGLLEGNAHESEYMLLLLLNTTELLQTLLGHMLNRAEVSLGLSPDDD